MNPLNTKIVILLIFSLLHLGTLQVFAVTKIPGTAAERTQRFAELQTSWQADKQPAVFREMVLVYSVIATLDGTDDETSLKKSLALFEEAKAILKTEDPELMAARGNGLTRRAVFTDSIDKKLHYSKQGTRLMDRAVKKDPQSFGARIHRGTNSLNLPKILGRSHVALEDFQTLLVLLNQPDLLLKENISDSGLPGFKALVLFRLAEAHELNEDPDQARKFWQQAADLAAGHWSKRAKERL